MDPFPLPLPALHRDIVVPHDIHDEAREIPASMVLEGHRETISCIDVTPNGRLALTCSLDGQARLWSLRSGQCSRIFPPPGGKKKGKVSSFSLACFSRDCKFVILAIEKDNNEDGGEGGGGEGDQQGNFIIQLWNIETSSLTRNFSSSSHSKKITSLCVSPKAMQGAHGWCSDLVLSTSEDCTAKLWAIESGECTSVFGSEGKLQSSFHPFGHGGAVICGAFVPYLANRTRGENVVSVVATGCADGIIRIWSVQSGKLLKCLSGHGDAVLNVFFAWQPHVAGGSGRKSVFKVSAAAMAGGGEEEEEGGDSLFAGNEPADLVLYSCSKDRTARSWRILSDYELEEKHQESTTPAAALTPEEEENAWIEKNASLLLVFRGHTAPIVNIDVGGSWGRERFRELKGEIDNNSNTRKNKQNKLEGEENSPAFFGRFLLTSSEDGTTRVWDALCGDFLRELSFGLYKQPIQRSFFLPYHHSEKTSVHSLPYSPFRIPSWQQQQQQGERNGNNNNNDSCNYLPNHILTVGDDGVGRVWDPIIPSPDAARSVRCMCRMRGHRGRISTAAVICSREGGGGGKGEEITTTTILTGSVDGSVRVWRIGERERGGGGEGMSK